jgi:hypothetical protein
MARHDVLFTALFVQADQRRSGTPLEAQRIDIAGNFSAEVGSRLAADRDPILGPISHEISTRYGEICRGPI